MKVLQILRELEENPTLITEKLEEIEKRAKELVLLENIYKGRITKLMNIIKLVNLPANKLIKVSVKLRDSLRDHALVQKEQKALEYFKNGNVPDRIESSLEYNINKWTVEAKENLEQLLD